jgi:hypothetical protein
LVAKTTKDWQAFYEAFVRASVVAPKPAICGRVKNTPTDLAVHTLVSSIELHRAECSHEGVSPCDHTEPEDNTLRADTWLKQNVPLITQSQEYKQGGALIILWDKAEDSGEFSHDPIGALSGSHPSPKVEAGRLTETTFIMTAVPR